MKARPLLQSLLHFPWRPAARTLRERLVEDRLSLSAGSLTFTTIIALVPFVTVVLAVFTAFPMFAKLQVSLQTWLFQSLVPDAISRQVLSYLTQFASKASRLGAVGVGVLVVTALSLVITIDRTLNNIWRVRRPRPLAQRLLIYWAALTLGPLLVGASVSISSYLLTASRGLGGGLPHQLLVLLDWFELLLLAAGLAAVYRFVPNVPVRARHAWAGGVFSALGIELARQLLALYIRAVPTYSAVYGAFATVPILLIWIYVAWLVVLLGAVLVAYLPNLAAGRTVREDGPGAPFQLALEVLRALRQARPQPRRGASLAGLIGQLRVAQQQLEPVLETLVALDWVGRLDEPEHPADARFVLLVEPASTPLAPLMRELLLPDNAGTRALWRSGHLSGATLGDAL